MNQLYTWCRCGKCLRVAGSGTEGDVLVFTDPDAMGMKLLARCPVCGRPLPEGLRSRDRMALADALDELVRDVMPET